VRHIAPLRIHARLEVILDLHFEVESNFIVQLPIQALLREKAA
jgi:hypothetical protein